jgi:hypothetical protein
MSRNARPGAALLTQLLDRSKRRAPKSRTRASSSTKVAVLVAMVVSLLPVAPAGAARAGARVTVDFEVATFSASEDAGVATLALVRSGESGGTSVVRVRSTGGTATVGSDYAEAVDLEVTFDRKQTRALVEIPLVADDRYEHEETITFKLSAASKNTGIGSQDTSTLAIGNDDAAPALSVSVQEAAVEGADIVATVQLDGPTDVPAKVNYATADASALAGQDYAAVSGTLTFPVGTAKQTVAVPTLGDDVHEADEVFSINLSAPVEATIATATAIAGINDDDIAHLIAIADASASEGGAVQFAVTLSRSSAARVYVDYVTEDDTALASEDYTAKSGTLAIDPGRTTSTISIPTAADRTPEPDEQFIVRLLNPRGAEIGDGTAIGTIIDASPLPVVSISHAATVVEGGTSTFRATLSEPSSREVTVRVTPQSGTASVGAAGSGADVAPSTPVTATFAPNAVTADVLFKTNNDAEREDPERFRAVLSHASGADIGPGTATGTIRDDDQCVALTASERRRVLDRWINNLDPKADEDGDGFTNGQELGVLAFDPDADPTRFNPLVADTPAVDVRTIGDLSVALFDSLTEGEEVGRVKLQESELIDVDRQEDIHATTETHEVGASIGAEGGTEGGKKKAVVSAGVDYRYSRSTTDQQTSEVTRGARELRSTEISKIVSSGREIEGGSIAVTVRVTNTGHVAFRVESAPLILRYRDDAGTLLAFGTMEPNFAFGQGPTLSPGQAKDVLYEIGGIGATDALALLEDASSLELGLADDLELSEIGVGSINVGAGNFAQYQNTIGQNTGSLDIDDGQGSTDRYLISTTSFRDPNGRPLGVAMCDAVQVLLQRELDVARDLVNGFPVTVDGEPVAAVNSMLLGVGTSGMGGGLVSEEEAVNARWITRVHTGSLGAEKRFYGPSDVLLRARQAAQLVYYRDEDKDVLELRDEIIFGTNDTDADSDDDGADDRTEATNAWQVVVLNRAGQVVLDYPVRSDPSSADVDRDSVRDPAERVRGTDPWLRNTDRDEYDDGVDGGLGPNGLAGAYFGTGYTLDAPEAVIDFANLVPTLVRTDPKVDFDWGLQTPASALPTDGFAVRWTGSLVVPEDGQYTLGGAADNGFRLYVDGVKIADHWATPGSAFASPIALQAFQPVPIVYEFWEGTGNAKAQLLYQEGSSTNTVPGNWLVPDPQTLDAPAHGLSAEHFFDANKNQLFDDGQPFYKVHDPLGPDHDWATGSPKSETVPYDYFMSRWTGFVTLPADLPAGDYTFGGKHDDGMKVTVGEDVVYDKPTTQGSPTYGTPIRLSPGERLPIVVEHWDTTAGSSVELWVTLPNATPQKVPATWLTPADAFSPFVRTIPPTKTVTIRNRAANNIKVKLTRGDNETGCDVVVTGGTEHPCQLLGHSFHNVLTVHEVGGGDDLVKDGKLTYDLPPASNECYEVTGDLVVGNSMKKVDC